jgi:hypothetical protein
LQVVKPLKGKKDKESFYYTYSAKQQEELSNQ